MSRRLRIVAGLLAVLVSGPARAEDPPAEQQPAEQQPAEEVSAERVRRTIVVRHFVELPATWMVIRDLDGQAADVNWTPNETWNLGIGVAYGYFGFNLRQNTAWGRDEDLYGRTRAGELTVNWYRERWGADLYASDHRGYFLADPSQGGPGCELGDPCSLAPDMTATRVGFHLFHIGVPESFSLAAAFNQRDVQLQSGGSWLVMGAGSTWWMSSSKPIVPEGLQADFGPAAGFQSGSFTNLVFGPGYGHTWIRERLYLTGVVLSGAGFQFQQYTTATETLNYVALVVQASVKAAVGYSGDWMFWGLSVHGDWSQAVLVPMSVSPASIRIQAFGGIRF